MKQRILSSLCGPAGALFVIAVSIALSSDHSSGACGDTKQAQGAIDHVRLIRAMPEAVESIALFRLDLMSDEQFPLAEFATHFSLPYFGLGRDQNELPSLEHAVFEAVIEAKPVARVIGGSDFDQPRGIGATEYNERNIIVTKRPLTDLQDQLRNGVDIQEELTRKQVRGHTMVSAEITRGSAALRGDVSYTFYVVVINEHTIVTARSQREIERIVERVEDAENATLPRRWRGAIADFDIQTAPLILLREYDPQTDDPYSPAHPVIREQLGITPPRTLALIMSDLESMALTGRLAGAALATEDAQEATVLEGVHALVGGMGFEVEWADDADGMRGILRPAAADIDDRLRFLSLLGLVYYLFGAPFYI